MVETTPLLDDDYSAHRSSKSGREGRRNGVAAASSSQSDPPMSSSPDAPGALARLQTSAMHLGLLLALDVLPDTALGYLVQYSRDDPGARILTAFTVASLVQTQLVAALQLALEDRLDAHRDVLKDPSGRQQLWVRAQAVWAVYMAFLPLAGGACGYVAWRSREALLGQNADVADVVWSLLVINLATLPFSLASTLMRSELETQQALGPLVRAAGISWGVGLAFAYILGYWTPLGFAGIALTGIITHGLQFRLLAPHTHLLTEWPGWHGRAAWSLVPDLVRHPAMIGMLLVNLAMVLFGYTSLLTCLIKPDRVILSAQESVFPSLVMLSFVPILFLCLGCSMKIKTAVKTFHGISNVKPMTSLAMLSVACGILTVVTTGCWLVIGLHTGESSVSPGLRNAMHSVLNALIVVYPPLGFLVIARPIFRTCVAMWRRASVAFVVSMVMGAIAGALFAEDMDGGIQGLWFGQWLGVFLFILIAACSIRSWASTVGSPSQPESEA